MTSALEGWKHLVQFVNGRTPLIGEVGVRDPENPCAEYDGCGYDGSGRCRSDGHYMCRECSHLAPNAPRFVEHGAEGRADRLRLFWSRPR